MIVAETRAELRSATGRTADRPRPRVALVPTMGALHAGHAELLGQGRRRADVLVASIFVNPLQFGPGEDLQRYPRAFDADLEVCAAQHVDVVFAPGVAEVYPAGDPQVTVDPGRGADILEGATRPGHFQGVLTVVAKLFGLVQPDIALFGEKDYQQLVLVTQMVSDLCMPIEVVGVPTVRDRDGLALSSRNRYLDPSQRSAAIALSGALSAASGAAAAGADAAVAAALDVLEAEPGLDLDYLSMRGTSLDPDPVSGPARLLVAARVGTTRLIDNTEIVLP